MSVSTPMELHAATTFLHRSLIEHWTRKCSTVSALVLHCTHLSESVIFNLDRYSFRRHFPSQSLVIVVSLALFWFRWCIAKFSLHTDVSVRACTSCRPFVITSKSCWILNSIQFSLFQATWPIKHTDNTEIDRNTEKNNKKWQHCTEQYQNWVNR